MISVTVVVPSRELPESFPAAARPLVEIHQRPAQGTGVESPCELCHGNGRLPRGDLCFRCDGKGIINAAYLVRFNYDDEAADSAAKKSEAVKVLDWAKALGHKRKALKSFAETGGEYFSSVISGLHGEKLEAMRIEKGKPLFWLSRGFIVTSTKTEGMVEAHEIDGGTLDHEIRILWRFEVEAGKMTSYAPVEKTSLEFPKLAVAEAIRKATDPRAGIVYALDGRMSAKKEGAWKR